MAGVGRGAAGASGSAGGVGEEQRRVLVQARLIAFEGEHVIGALVDDALGDLFLCPHRIDRDDRALEIEHVQEFRDRGGLVGFSVDRALRQH